MYKDLQTALQNISDNSTNDYALKNNCNTLAAEAGNLAEQYTPKQKQEEGQEKAQVSPTVPLTKKEKISQKKVEKDKEELKQAQKKYVNSVIEAEKIKNAKQVQDERLAAIKKAEDARLAATKKANEEAAAKQAAEDAKIDAQAKIKLDTMQALVKKEDTSLTASDSSNVVETSDSSNVAETSNFSKGYVSIYPPLDGVGAEIVPDQIADAKASSSINVYNSSPFSYTAENHKTVPITTVMPTLRTASTATNTEDVVEDSVGDNAPNTLVDTSSSINGHNSSTATNAEDVVEDSVGANAPNTLVYTVINLLNSNDSNDSNDKEVYKIFIESCKNLRATSEENYQLLKTIAEKTTDTDIQLAALTAAKSKTDNPKQQAELFLSKGKILLSLGKKDQASHEFGEAAVYNHDIYKDVAEETLKSLYESGNHEVGYWYLSKTHNFSYKDPIIAKKLVEFSRYVNLVHGVQGEAACLIKAYLCAPNAAALVKVQNDLSIMASIPYAADYYKNYCAVRDTAQIETFLQGIVQVIDEHM